MSNLGAPTAQSLAERAAGFAEMAPSANMAGLRSDLAGFRVRVYAVGEGMADDVRRIVEPDAMTPREPSPPEPGAAILARQLARGLAQLDTIGERFVTLAGLAACNEGAARRLADEICGAALPLDRWAS